MSSSSPSSSSSSLLQRRSGAAVICEKCDRRCSLFSAISRRHPQCVRALVTSKRVSVHDVESRYGTPSLSTAVEYDRSLEIAKFLLESGADITATDNEGITPVCHAIAQTQPDAVIFLVKNGANFETPGFAGLTPLMQCCKYSWTAVAECLINHGASLDAVRESDGNTALIIAAQYGAVDEVKLLIKAGADPTICNSEGQRALDCVVSKLDEQDRDWDDFKKEKKAIKREIKLLLKDYMSEYATGNNYVLK